MLELAALHVYDLARSEEASTCASAGARKAEAPQRADVEVDESVLCITDDPAIGLAGIMGGDSTKRVPKRAIFSRGGFLLSAGDRRPGGRYNFVSDASHRFERGVDFEVARAHRASTAWSGALGGEAGPWRRSARLPEPDPAHAHGPRAQGIGMDLPSEEMSSSLPAWVSRPLRTRLSDCCTVTPPSYGSTSVSRRPDREVARLRFRPHPGGPPVAPAV